MQLFILITVTDIIVPIIGIVSFLVIIPLMYLLIARVFNVRVVNRSGTTIAEPDDARKIASGLSELGKKTFNSILNKIKQNNSKDYNVINESSSGKIMKMMKLYELKQKGIINDEELEILKKEIFKSDK